MISVSVLIKVQQFGIDLVICDEKHQPSCSVIPINGYYRYTDRVNKQIKWSDSRKNKCFKNIIDRKINHQIDVLDNFGLDSYVLKENLDKLGNDNVLEIEALCAKCYFINLFGLDFNRHEVCEINAALNYGYGLLRSKIRQIISVKGLVSCLGVNHCNQYNNYNLADDIIEVYRPMVDYYVYLHLVRDDFTRLERRTLQKTLINNVIFNGSYISLHQSIEYFIDSLISFMNKDSNDLDIPILEIGNYV